MMATEYGMFAANPMGASFDQSSTGPGAPAIGGWSANQQRVPPAVSTLRRTQHAAISSPRYSPFTSTSFLYVLNYFTNLLYILLLIID